MATPTDLNLIFGPLLKKSEDFKHQLAAAILAATSSNQDIESQHRRKIAALEAEIERLRGSKTPLDLYPTCTPAPNNPGIVDDLDCVAQDEHDKTLKSLQHIDKKNYLVKQRLDHSTVDSAELGKGTPRAQDDKQRELDMERAKVKEFERKFGTITRLLDLSQTVIQAVIKTSTDAARHYRKYGEDDDLWVAEMLEKGTIAVSDLDRRPTRNPWPDIATPLRHLSTSISENNIMRTRGQSIPPLTRSTASRSILPPPAEPLIQPSKPTSSPPTTQDPDATSDEEDDSDEEEAESALQKFSPTSKAIMRKPGSETLAVLHTEPLSPIHSHNADVDWEVTEDALVDIKSEPMSGHDWYSKYGYSRIVDGEQETFDLDNVTASRRGSVGIRGAGRMITTPEKDGIRTSFLTQSSLLSQRTISSGNARKGQPSASNSKLVHNEPVVISDTPEEDSALLRTPAETAKLKDPAPTINARAIPTDLLPTYTEDTAGVPSKQKLPLNPVTRTEASRATGVRNPLGEILDPNGLQEPGSIDTTNPQPSSGKKRLDNLTADEEIHDKENPPIAKNWTDLLSTPTQNNRLPPMVARSTGALKLKRKSLGSISATKKPLKRSSLVFPPHQPVAGVIEITHAAAAATPGGKRPQAGPQGNSHKKKQRTEESTTPTGAAAVKKPDNPLSPSKYRINKTKNEGFDFAFSEVVRDKARKDCLPKCVKECCRDLASGKLYEMWKPPAPYESAKFGARDSSPPDEEEAEVRNNEQYKEWNNAREKSERNLQFGRHRAQHQKAAEVMGYWESDFPTTQLLEEQRKESERRHMEKGFDRYEQATKGGMYERRA
ncbi:hypothetical protein TWF506_004539 [Arthrobotrys conoides]|uniref:DNA endonuclease activator Ctp1 C-terminal domain-containing protein n=1 Tax=Arthrobotrys conoides TaxID=74498 RepID=A0AAN8NEW7_9PEZI